MKEKCWYRSLWSCMVTPLKDLGWELLKVSPLLFIILIALITFRAIPQLYSALMSLSMLAFILIAVNIMRQFLIHQFKMGDVYKEGMKSPLGAAIIFSAMLLFILGMVFVTMARADTMIDRASPYIPVLQENYQKYWPDAPLKENMPAQIEQESLWKRLAQLKTSRELGRGFSQMTIAYNKDGSERFNKYVEARQRYKELRGWDWQSDAFNADYNLLFVVLEDHRNFITYQKSFDTDLDRWAATLICYNAGCGTVNSRLSICSTTEGCDSGKWFGGLDSVASTSEKSAKLYGRNLADERNKYPQTVIFTRSPKYQEFFKDDLCIMCHLARSA